MTDSESLIVTPSAQEVEAVRLEFGRSLRSFGVELTGAEVDEILQEEAVGACREALALAIRAMVYPQDVEGEAFGG